MSGDGLRPRPGPAPRLIEGPRSGNRSLYAQHVLDEDTYTEALSHIIQRDFYPTLPHLHATNDYLSALANNDPELLSSSIRRLARIAAEKEGKGGKERGDTSRREGRAHEGELLDMGDTPYMAVGARGWDTPLTTRRPAEAEDIDSFGPGPSSKRRKTASAELRKPQIRDDLSLDAFQRNYTSEDNASFAQIVDEENARRREEKTWAWKAERVSEDRRIAGDERRKMILDAATGGGWRVDANGRRMIGGLAEGARGDAEAWKSDDVKLITAAEADGAEAGAGSTALVRSKSQPDLALVKATAASSTTPPSMTEQSLPPEHPLSRALASAGLPTTALISTADGAIVPQRETVSGSGDGRGRGAADREERDRVEKAVMGDEEKDNLEGHTQQWGYKAMNSLMFLPDANENPYPKPKPKTETTKPLANPPSIAYRNTRLQEEEDEPSTRAGSTRRGSSPARSWVDAAVRGDDYIPRHEREEENAYPLLPEDAGEPDPEELPPLMTWGTLLATPRRLDGTPDDLAGPSFRLPEPKRRDEIGRKLGAKAGKSIADRAKAYAPAPSTPRTPSLSEALRAAANKTKTGDRSVRGSGSMLPPSTPRREGNLTPAARSLLDRSLGRTPQRSGLGLGLGSGGGARGAAMEKGSGWGRSSSMSKSWTPSPAPRR